VIDAVEAAASARVIAELSKLHVQSDANVPKTMAEALQGPDAKQWQRAFDSEMKSMQDNNVYELVMLPEGKRTIGSRIILNRKRADENGDMAFKVRLVAKGYTQVAGIDYDLTYAPVCKLTTLRAILAVAARDDLCMRQFDVKTAFLNADLDEELYMEQPKGFEQGPPGTVCRLLKSLYGIKQAGRLWSLKWAKDLIKAGFVRSYSDPSLFLLHDDSGTVICGVYVDDGIIAGVTQTLVDAAFTIIANAFEVRDLGEPTDFLGIQITRDRAARTLTIHQANYVA
jgi:hypothetical protein